MCLEMQFAGNNYLHAWDQAGPLEISTAKDRDSLGETLILNLTESKNRPRTRGLSPEQEGAIINQGNGCCVNNLRPFPGSIRRRDTIRWLTE